MLCRRQRTLNGKLSDRVCKGPLNPRIPSRGLAAQDPAGQPTAQLSKPRVKANEIRASMAAPDGVFGARYAYGSTRKRRSCLPARSCERFELLGSGTVVKMARISSLELFRDQDALYETAGPIVDGTGRQPAGRGNPTPHRRAQPLHRPWHARHRWHGINPSGKQGSPPIIGFDQQSHIVGQHESS